MTLSADISSTEFLWNGNYRVAIQYSGHSILDANGNDDSALEFRLIRNNETVLEESRSSSIDGINDPNIYYMTLTPSQYKRGDIIHAKLQQGENSCNTSFHDIPTRNMERSQGIRGLN